MKLEIMNPDNYREKADNIRKESVKKMYFSPVIECIKLDNEISLILNSFDGLPGDPNPKQDPDCVMSTKKENNTESPWA